MLSNVMLFVVITASVILLLIVVMLASWYKKIPQGQALVRTGSGGTKVAFDRGMLVVPVLHMVESMDLSVKTIEIAPYL